MLNSVENGYIILHALVGFRSQINLNSIPIVRLFFLQQPYGNAGLTIGRVKG
jgi:hypothetical protein